MAERVFDYEKIAEIYKSMNEITGDAGTPGTIAGILQQANLEIENKVNVSEQAIFGDLGSQLKLDWDNFSSGFPNFVANFNNWATVVAKANNDYTQFEQDVQGFRDTHQFGVAAATNMTDAFVNTGYYSNAHTADEIADLQNMAQFYELTGASYTDTGMVAYAKKAGFWNAVGDILNVAAIAVSGYTVVSQVGRMITAASATTKAASGAVAAGSGGTGTASQVQTAAKVLGARNSTLNAMQTVKGTPNIVQRFARTGFGSRLLSNPTAFRVASGVSRSLDFLHYYGSTTAVATGGGMRTMYAYSINGLRPLAMTGAAAAAGGFVSDAVSPDYTYSVVGGVGSQYTMNNQVYTYCGTTTSGNNLYIDENDNIVYKAGDGSMQSVTNASGTPVTMTSMDSESSLVVNGVDVGNAETLSATMNVSEVNTEIKDYSTYMGTAGIRTSAANPNDDYEYPRTPATIPEGEGAY